MSQMNLTINSPVLARRLPQFLENWEKVTQDRWVLQAIRGYQLELVQTPRQLRPMPTKNCSIEQKAMITKEVKELLAKGSVVESIPSQEGFVSQIFLVEKREGTEAGNKPEGTQQVCEARTFQNGGASHPSPSHPCNQRIG